MKLTSVETLLVHELKDLYSAENQLLKALPKMAKAAASAELRRALEEHLEETRGQVARLERIFERFEFSPRGKKCRAMEALIEEGKELIEGEGEPEVIDAALIAAAQKVEHYEIAAYGCARTFARLHGDEEAARLLHETLQEESRADAKLTRLAEGMVNLRAAEASGVEAGV
jgi:ferritin-like metal-binding protein YciE